MSLDCPLGLFLKILCQRLGSLASKYELHSAFFAQNNDDSISSKTFIYQWKRGTEVGAYCVPRLYHGFMF